MRGNRMDPLEPIVTDVETEDGPDGDNQGDAPDGD